MQNKEIYIGLIEVHGQEGSELLDPGAVGFVNILALAENEQDYVLKVNEAIRYYRLVLKTIEEVESLKERQKHFIVDKELLDLAKTLNDNKELRFGTFHTWYGNARSK